MNYNDLNKDQNHQKELLNNELQLHQQRLLQQQQQQQQLKTSPIRQNNQNDNQSSNNTFNTSSNNGRSLQSFDHSNYENSNDVSTIIDSIPFDYSSHLINQQNVQNQQQQQNNESYDVNKHFVCSVFFL